MTQTVLDELELRTPM